MIYTEGGGRGMKNAMNENDDDDDVESFSFFFLIFVVYFYAVQETLLRHNSLFSLPSIDFFPRNCCKLITGNFRENAAN